MTDEEQIEVIRHTVDTVQHRIPVIAGCGSNDTRHGAQLSAMAEQAGVRCFIKCYPLITIKQRSRDWWSIFHTFAKAVSVPVIL